jgi:hypothetical protein
MATQKQITANRANAKRSTGPRTAAGRSKSSHNTYRHGLSCQRALDSVGLAMLDSIARALIGNDASDDQVIAAKEIAEAQLELRRIRDVRRGMIQSFDTNSIWDLRAVAQLVAVDRYEREARTKCRRQLHLLSDLSSTGAKLGFDKTNPN